MPWSLTGNIKGPQGIPGSSIFVNTLADLKAAVLTGGRIFMGNNTISLTSSVDITVPTVIIGGKFTLPPSTGFSGFRVTSSNVTFEGSEFTGPGTASVSYASVSRFVYFVGTQAAPLQNVKMINCKMVGSQSDCVRMDWVRDSIVSGCFLDDYLYAGIMLISVDNVTVAQNLVSNAVMKGSVVNVYGIATTDSLNTAAARSKNVRIIGNTVKNVPWEGIDTHGGDGIIIVGNTVINCPRAIALVVGSETRVTSPINCIVEGNFVDRAGATYSGAEREGISVYGLSDQLADAHIIGNTIRGYSSAKAMYLEFTDPLKTLVEGNSHPHVPWTDLVMTNTAQWNANATYPPQYMIDGRRVHLRGFVVPSTGTTTTTTITSLPAICKGDRALTFVATSHGSNSAAGVGTILVNASGTMQMAYKTGTDLYSYPIEGSYMRAFG